MVPEPQLFRIMVSTGSGRCGAGLLLAARGWLHQQQADSNQPQAEACDLGAVFGVFTLFVVQRHHLREEGGRAVEASDRSE